MMTPENIFTILKIVGAIGGGMVLISSLWALFTRRDRRYRKEYREFLEQERRVDEQLSASRPKRKSRGDTDSS
jgi:hypothetical protein